jgi:hypothetical protein
MVIVIREPAGMTTRPRESVTSLLTVVVTTSPALLLRELISWSTAVAMTVPDPSASGAGAGAGAGAGLGAGLGFGLAATGFAGATGAAGAESLSTAEESTGTRCRSRLRLSAAMRSGLSAAHAARSVTAKSDSRLPDISPPFAI